jgi:hypothetical protein
LLSFTTLKIARAIATKTAPSSREKSTSMEDDHATKPRTFTF